jgi:hypothetical protein
MREPIWIVVHTPADQPNVVAGPFNSFITASEFVSLDYEYESISFHHSIESALADTSKVAFVPPAA